MSNRYEYINWKTEDWEAYNRLKGAALERQRAEFLEDLDEFELKRYSDMMRTLTRIRKKWGRRQK